MLGLKDFILAYSDAMATGNEAKVKELREAHTGDEFKQAAKVIDNMKRSLQAGRTRDAVRRFADLMNDRMTQKSGEKGELGYRSVSIDDLYAEMHKKIVRLGAAIRNKDEDDAIRLSVDAANYLMMIVDNLVVTHVEL